jgi:hypothetical protein
MSVLEKLTEGIINRDLSKEGNALLSKWEKTGLLEGIGDDQARESMARLLENQAKELLREASTMAAGDVEGFASVAFPIVRRVFGGLVANEIVSVQPMSLPSGLIFFLDFQHTNSRLGADKQDSLFGGNRVGQEITGGVSLTGLGAEKSFYNLNNGYSHATASVTIDWNNETDVYVVTGSGGADAGGGTAWGHAGAYLGAAHATLASLGDRLIQYDPDLSGTNCAVISTVASDFEGVSGKPLNVENLVGIKLGTTGDDLSRTHAVGSVHKGLGTGVGVQVRRLTRRDPNDSTRLLFVLAASGSETLAQLSSSLCTPAAAGNNLSGASFPVMDPFSGTPAAGSNAALGAVVGEDTWGLETNQQIPEIDIKVDSVSVTAMTKKLKAKWSPELGQDLNAYHNLDAEVELTSILSEQIALEIDQEILEDLVKLASAGTYYWSRHAGKFVYRKTGREVGAATATPDFTGTVSEWYETLVETINDISAQIHRKTLRGGANFLVMGPEVANILEFTAGFRANITGDDNKGTVGAVNVGSLSKKWDVWVNPYFPRNVVLVGRRGNSFLESGYVYSPYVPLQVTPTIFGVEDFVPRKGVMTRYAKKMVRPDMYGLVIVTDLV